MPKSSSKLSSSSGGGPGGGPPGEPGGGIPGGNESSIASLNSSSNISSMSIGANSPSTNCETSCIVGGSAVSPGSIISSRHSCAIQQLVASSSISSNPGFEGNRRQEKRAKWAIR